MTRLVLLFVAFSLAGSAVAHAADVKVSYLVDAKVLKKGAPAGTVLTVTIFADSSCSVPLDSRTMNVESVMLIESLKPLAIKGASPGSPPARIEFEFTGASPQMQTYATVTGTGVMPIGGACQLQPAFVGGSGGSPPSPCPADSVPSGNTCIDKYEASLWSIPPGATAVIQHVKDGTATLAELNGAGATQFSVACGPGGGPLACPPPTGECVPAMPGTFPPDGNYTDPLYAVALAGVIPSACLTAYQADAACRASTKHLLTNSEWTLAAQGTPRTFTDDASTTCNVGAVFPFTPVNTGSRSGCVSTAGVFDMFGNVSEWTYDPGTWLRGGNADNGGDNTLFLAIAHDPSTYTNATAGFRCGR
jgi:hypothetical protein